MIGNCLQEHSYVDIVDIVNKNEDNCEEEIDIKIEETKFISHNDGMKALEIYSSY